MTDNHYPGFYVIKHLPTGKHYGGSSKSVKGRLDYHKSALSLGKHYNVMLQEAFTTWDDCEVSITATDDVSEARELEQEYLDANVGTDLCCNLATGSTRPWVKGKMSERMKQIIKDTNTGRVMSSEHKEKIALSVKNNPNLRSTIEKSLLVTSKRILIDGIVYASISEVSRLFKITRKTVVLRLNSPDVQHANWQWYLKEI